MTKTLPHSSHNERNQEGRGTWQFLLTSRRWVFKEIDGLYQREPGRNVVRILVNLVHKGLEFPNGLLAPSYVVSNTFGEKERKKEGCLALDFLSTSLPGLSFHIPPHNICNVNAGTPSLGL